MKNNVVLFWFFGFSWLLTTGSVAQAHDEKVSASSVVTLQLKWQHAFQFAGYYAAEAQGFYREVGLDVRFSEGKPGVDAVQEVISGRADFGVGTTELLLNRQQGAPITILGVVYQHSPLQLAVLEESGIKNANDLNNKRVMMEQKASPELRAFLNLELSYSPDLVGFLKRSGVVRERYQTVEHTHTLEALLSKQVDAMSIYTTNQPFELNEQAVAYRILSPQMSGIDFYGDNLFTTDYLIRSNPKLVSHFYHASMKGWRYALDHPEEIIDLIHHRYSQRMSKAHLRYEAQVTAQLMQANLIQPGYMNLDRWRHIVSVYQRLGDLPQEFTIEQMLHQEDEEAIKTLNKQLLWSILGFVLVSAIGLVLWYFYRRAKIGWYRLEMLLKHVPSAVMIIDVRGKIQLWNKGAERIFGWTEEEALREDALALLVPRGQQEEISALFQRVKRQQKVEHSKNANLHKDGHGLVCEWVNTPYRDERNQQDYLLCMAYDVTKMETWSELVHAKEEAEQASLAKAAFVAMLSRSLKRPFEQLLHHPLVVQDASALAVLSDQGCCQLVQDIQSVAQKGMHLIEQVIVLSDLESGRLRLQNELFSVKAVVDMLVMKMTTQCAEKGLAFVYDYAHDAPSVITADAERLNQVLESLLTNAIEFTTEGTVTFRVSAKDRSLWFEVTDTGAGMDMAMQNALFQGISDRERADQQGVGLSLILAKSLISAMGGRLDFESQLDKGSRFWVVLPVLSTRAG